MSGIRSEMRLPLDAPRTGEPQRLDLARIMAAFRPAGRRQGRPRNPCVDCGSETSPTVRRTRDYRDAYYCIDCAPPRLASLTGRVRPGSRSEVVYAFACRYQTVTPAMVAEQGITDQHTAGVYLAHLARVGLLSRRGRGVYGVSSCRG